MKTLNILFVLLFLSCNSIELSEEMQSLKDNSITISELSKLDDKIYKEISAYDVIMVGEMHGTKEPAEFAFGLCKLISNKEERVVLALEIPPLQMENFSNKMSVKEIKDLDFFKGEGSDGRNGEAWLALLDNSNKNGGIEIKFIDSQSLSTRDSSMYRDICEIRKNYPNTKIVTLTGNIHNWLKPFANEMRLGGFVVNDTINFNAERIMSINHIFNRGTMLNNRGNGLELTTYEGKDNIFNKTISSKKIFCKRIFEDRNEYTHFLYTDEVTHSDTLVNR